MSEWAPNFIDYRHSLVVADRREAAGETVPVCQLELVGFPRDVCGTPLDTDPVAHHPRCPAVAAKPAPPRLCQEDGCDKEVDGPRALFCRYHRRRRHRRRFHS